MKTVYAEKSNYKNSSQITPATGPLRIGASNPRYFTDGDKVIYLTGSHTWDNFQDWGLPTQNFNYLAYLDFLEESHHNFIRIWVHEQPPINPLPWQRTGLGVANDGKPKFDITKFNQEYFDRLRSRVIEAGKRGIYVSIMFFNRYTNWAFHPFNGANNVNGIDGDLNKDGDGKETHTLATPFITKQHEAYIQKIIDTVNDLDNVLYEIGNELEIDTLEWQYHLIKFIHDYEANKPKQHPVGMTTSGGANTNYITNQQLFDSPADWISPRRESSQDYSYDPPSANGKKIIVTDTDHLLGVLEHPMAEWVWKSFLRGLNPILMDVLQNRAPDITKDWNDPNRPELPLTRLAMRHTLTYANRMNLAKMIPRNDLASTQYCLADPGNEYLIYLPSSSAGILNRFTQFFGIRETVTVNLSEALGTLKIEWFSPGTGEVTDGGTVTGGAIRSFKAPFGGDAVLYIYDSVEKVPNSAFFKNP